MCQGSRPKPTQLFHLLPQLCCLNKQCDQQHQWAEWGRVAGGWATAQEAAYPVQLYKEWAHLLIQELLDLGAEPLPTSLAEVHAQLPHHRLAKSHRVWSAEFKTFAGVSGLFAALPSGKRKHGFQICRPVSCNPTIADLPAGSKVVGPPVIQGGVGAASDLSFNSPPNVSLCRGFRVVARVAMHHLGGHCFSARIPMPRPPLLGLGLGPIPLRIFCVLVLTQNPLPKSRGLKVKPVPLLMEPGSWPSAFGSRTFL